MLVLEEEQTKIAVGDELVSSSSGQWTEPSVKGSRRFCWFPDLGCRCVEVLVVGLDEPLLVKEELAGLVLHAIVASSNSAIQPWDVVLVEVLAQVDHRVL